MGIATGLTAARMLEIENASVVSGTVNGSGDLVLTTHGGQTIVAGHVKGADGDDGADATALLTVAETPTMTLALAGAGTPASPWVLSASAKSLQTTGLLDPAYRTAGPASVKLSGASTFTGPYKWLQQYVPQGSREVILQKDLVNDTWFILAQKDTNKVPLLLATGWDAYSAVTSSAAWAFPKAQLLPSGIVVLSGLIRASGTPASGAVITTLPVGMRPDYELLVGVNQSDSARYISIRANGEIRAGENFSALGFVSLDGIAFPAAGVASWTLVDPAGTAGSDHTFANSWHDYTEGSDAYGQARYWKDPYGFVWLGGVVAGGGTADNTRIFNMPTTHAAYKQQHIATSSTAGMGIVGIKTGDSGINYKTGSVGNYWVSLAGVTIVTTDAHNNNPWKTWPALLNSWGNFGTDYKPAASLRRGDGLGFLHGMLVSGVLGQKFAYFLEEESTPPRDMLMQVASGASRGRLDIAGKEFTDGTQSGVYAEQGKTEWFSLDSVKYMI